MSGSLRVGRGNGNTADEKNVPAKRKDVVERQGKRRKEGSLDETLPADCGTRLLAAFTTQNTVSHQTTTKTQPDVFPKDPQVNPHYDSQTFPTAGVDLRLELSSVLQRLCRVVNAAWTEDDEKAVVMTVDNL
jgi:hypothetical protein